MVAFADSQAQSSLTGSLRERGQCLHERPTHAAPAQVSSDPKHDFRKRLAISRASEHRLNPTRPRGAAEPTVLLPTDPGVQLTPAVQPPPTGPGPGPGGDASQVTATISSTRGGSDG